MIETSSAPTDRMMVGANRAFLDPALLIRWQIASRRRRLASLLWGRRGLGGGFGGGLTGGHSRFTGLETGIAQPLPSGANTRISPAVPSLSVSTARCYPPPTVRQRGAAESRKWRPHQAHASGPEHVRVDSADHSRKRAASRELERVGRGLRRLQSRSGALRRTRASLASNLQGHRRKSRQLQMTSRRTGLRSNASFSCFGRPCPRSRASVLRPQAFFPKLDQPAPRSCFSLLHCVSGPGKHQGCRARASPVMLLWVHACQRRSGTIGRDVWPKRVSATYH